MSRKRLLVALESGRVSWLQLASALKPRVLAQRTVEVDSEYGPGPWHGALAALRQEAEAWRGDASAVTIVLSNHFVRYALVPPSTGVQGVEEERALARHYFARVHGEQSRAWDVRLSGRDAGSTRIASAIDGGLMDALRACFPTGSGPRLVSVQPLLMSAFNCWRSRFPKRGAWLLLVEPERACLALCSAQNWLSVQNAKGQYADAQAWAVLLDRERWRTNLDEVPDTVFLYSPRAQGTPLSQHGAWKFNRLLPAWPRGLSPAEDAAHAAALTAA